MSRGWRVLCSSFCEVAVCIVDSIPVVAGSDRLNQLGLAAEYAAEYATLPCSRSRSRETLFVIWIARLAELVARRLGLFVLARHRIQDEYKGNFSKLIEVLNTSALA